MSLSAAIVKARGKGRALYWALILFPVLLVAAWGFSRDQIQIMQRLAKNTRDAWGLAQNSLDQRNAVLKLSVRILMVHASEKPAVVALRGHSRRGLNRLVSSKGKSLPDENIIRADRDLEPVVSDVLKELSDIGIEKLADLLASSQNRLALLRYQYDKRAMRLMREMETFRGAVAARFLEIQPPLYW